jgi:4-amino-4-deoxy-L-arabinose transferase-like glycosyltransferase
MRAWLADVIDDAVSFWSGPRGRRSALRLCRGPVAGLALTLLATAVYLPGIASIPAVDRDESRFAQASRQMFEASSLPPDQRSEALHSGGVVEPRVADRSRLNKPPLIYWLQAASAAIVTGAKPESDAIWMYRLPSMIAATLAVLFTWRAGLILFDPRAAALGAALLAISPMVVWDAHQARADQLLLACTTAAFWLLSALYRRATRRDPTPSKGWKNAVLPSALAVTVALGVLAKGPITPMIVLLTVAALGLATRQWRWTGALRPVTALVIVLALTVPWLFALAARVGFAEYASIVFDETLGRSASPKEGHWGPPGYHTVLLAVLFWPGSVLTALSIVQATTRARGTHHADTVDIPAAPPEESTEAKTSQPSTGEEPNASPPSAPSNPDPKPEPEPEPAAKARPETMGPDVIPLEPEPDPIPPPAFKPAPAPPTPDHTAPAKVERPPLSVRLRAFARSATRPASGRRSELFCLAWIIPSWIIFELVSTKLPHYTLPLYPAIALLSARTLLAACAGSVPGLTTAGTRLGLQLWLLIGAVLTSAAPLAIAIFGGAGLAIIPAAFLAAGCFYLLWLAREAIARSLLARAVTLAAVAAVTGLVSLVGVVLPNASSLWITERLIASARDAGWTTNVPIAALEYHEDSLVFATRARLNRIDESDLASWARANRGLLIAPTGTHTALQADATVRTRRLDTIQGYNYSTGRITQLELLATNGFAVAPTGP